MRSSRDLVRAGHARAVRHRVAVPRRRVGAGRGPARADAARSSRSTFTTSAAALLVVPDRDPPRRRARRQGRHARSATVRNGGITLLSLSSKIPVTVAQLRADPSALKTAPLVRDRRDARRSRRRTLLAVLGNTPDHRRHARRQDRDRGHGRQADGEGAVHRRANITVPAGGGEAGAGRERADDRGDLGRRGRQGRDRRRRDRRRQLQITRRRRKDHLAHATASLVREQLDLAPLVAVLARPGRRPRRPPRRELRARRRRPAHRASSPARCTHRRPHPDRAGRRYAVPRRPASVDVKDKKRRREARRQARPRRRHARPRMRRSTAFSPNSGKAKLTIHKVQLIGTTEPIIDGTVDANLARVDDKWTANLTSIEAHDVESPTPRARSSSRSARRRTRLQGRARKHIEPPSPGPGARYGTPTRKPPANPIFVANITVKNTHVESNEVRGYVNGKLHVTMDDHEMGVIGNVVARRRRPRPVRSPLHGRARRRCTSTARSIRCSMSASRTTSPRSRRSPRSHGRMSKPELAAVEPACDVLAGRAARLLARRRAGRRSERRRRRRATRSPAPARRSSRTRSAAT